MSRIFTILVLVLLAEPGRAQELQPIDASTIEGQQLPAIVEPAIITGSSDQSVVVVKLPFPGNASRGRAVCHHQAAGAASPRIRLHCNRIILQDY